MYPSGGFMYKILSSEINKLEKIGSGNFGTAYRKDDMILKVYHEYVKAYNESFCATEMVRNPDLIYNPIKYEYLKHKNYKLEYTDLISDILFVDGKFKGIVMPYYNGETFKEHLYDDFNRKVAMSRQLILNAKELTNNYIYPLDYKSSNIMMYNNKIQIIDLDDAKTKVLNPIYKKESIETLDTAIKCFIGDIDYNLYINARKKEVRKYLLKKENLVNTSYKEIEDYLARIIIKNNYIFINEDTDYIELLRNPNYRVILLYKNNKMIYEKIKKLLSLNIKLYDIVPESSLKDYLSSISYEELLEVKEKELRKVKI